MQPIIRVRVTVLKYMTLVNIWFVPLIPVI